MAGPAHYVPSGVVESTDNTLTYLLKGTKRDGLLRFNKIHRWDDERLLVGYRTRNRESIGRGSYTERDVQSEVDRLYAAFGKQTGEIHPSKPPDRMIPQNESTPLHTLFKAATPLAYHRENEDITDSSIFDISKTLYFLLPHSKQTPWPNCAGSNREDKKEVERARTCLPIRLNQQHVHEAFASLGMSNTDKVAWPWHASTITHTPEDNTEDNTEVDTRDGNNEEEAADKEELEGEEEIDNKDEEGECARNNSLQQKFSNMPLLNIYDSMLLIPLPQRESNVVLRSHVLAESRFWGYSGRPGDPSLRLMSRPWSS
ncbi:hypothetical protein OPT61_g9690 [Boeremia exigua]|uniref:Uncharacterized protein n=1 Tax=Boeremia exigua TaxID=749465 RepID=A0ACC2HT73_9PLEO|nr:hypothetical protein OPT61_g9690 [Boeremia exigua]